jgi:fatty-acyl-CoA synthase
LSAAGWRNPASIKNIWSLVERFKPETLTSIAAVLAIPLGNADVSSLRYVAGGGSAIPVAIGKAIQDSSS